MTEQEINNWVNKPPQFSDNFTAMGYALFAKKCTKYPLLSHEENRWLAELYQKHLNNFRSFCDRDKVFDTFKEKDMVEQIRRYPGN